VADTNLQGLSAATPVATDEIEFLDKSDTGMSAEGSNKRTPISDVLTLYSGPFVGTWIVRQSGGTVDVDEMRLYHDGTQPWAESMQGDLRLKVPSASVGDVVIGSPDGGNPGITATAGTLQIGGASRSVQLSGAWTVDAGSGALRTTSSFDITWASDVGIRRGAAGVLTVTNASTGGGILEFPQVTAGGTPSTNSARIYSKDVAGNAELFVKDEAGTETQVSPHSVDGPVSLYDTNDSLPHVVKEVNDYIGGVRYLNLSRACMLLEDLLKAIAAGQTLANIRTFLNNRGPGFIDIYRTESFASHNTRLGLTGENALVVRDWSNDQDAKQLEYNEARANELAKYDEWVEREEARQIAHDEWELIDPAIRGPEPQLPGVEPEPIVRPAIDIRKPVPAWLSSRGVAG
jgi:hypothetical protein